MSGSRWITEKTIGAEITKNPQRREQISPNQEIRCVFQRCQYQTHRRSRTSQHVQTCQLTSTINFTHQRPKDILPWWKKWLTFWERLQEMSIKRLFGIRIEQSCLSGYHVLKRKYQTQQKLVQNVWRRYWPRKNLVDRGNTRILSYLRVIVVRPELLF